MKQLKPPYRFSRMFTTLLQWFDSYAGIDEANPDDPSNIDTRQVEWVRILPFIALHIGCLGLFLVGWSPVAVGTAIALYLIRMFAITGFYHRYFSHKSFRTSRFWQFVFAVAGNSSVQRGPLWWAAHHRHHHRFADTENDIHSPVRHGFFWSHIGWITSSANFPTRMKYVREWAAFPELNWINRFDTVIPLLLAISLYGIGELLEAIAPGLGTTGPQMLVWGFFVSTVFLYHATATINSLDHMYGTRRYDTPDTSRNNFFLALLTLGEGWHNNHHHYAVTARQGFFWWEIDMTYYLLVAMSRLGIVHDLRPVPDRRLHPEKPVEKPPV